MVRAIRATSLLLLAVSTTASGQVPTRMPGPFSFSLAVGPSRAFRGVDAPGVHGQGGVSYSLGRGFGLSLEGAREWYEAQPLYPCLVQDAGVCYQTMRRAVGAGTLSATYHMSRFRDDKTRSTPYLITGIGIYKSRRIATRYPECRPGELCDSNVYKLQLRDTQFGWSGGAGLDARLGRVGVFAETRVHYVYNDRRSPEPSNDYFAWP